MNALSPWTICRFISLAAMIGMLALAGDKYARATPHDDAPQARVQFNRDIRPILTNKCFACHGLDNKARKADLRLDVRDRALLATEGGNIPIVPARPNESEVIRRIFSNQDATRMPPATSNKNLTTAEKELIKRWIEQGAEYQSHWSFIVPKRAELPKIALDGWAKNPIDYFIVNRLQAEGLRPSPEADRATLIRRVTFDLTGLPPTPAEVDAFLADTRADAYEKVVDRLLDSPRFGERMAVDWLDAARFADTHGYHIDSGRDMTRWREWVINAFNRNMPFDQFTIEQLAGDHLPNATVDQKIASGFNRNHMINYEGGAIPAEYHNAYIVDRVNTTGTVWLGLTVGCAQCHEHKYDPISQKEYYGLYAFFHNLPENGLDGRAGNAVPVLKLPTLEQQQKLDQLAASIKETDQRITGPIPDVDAAQVEWEKTYAGENKLVWLDLNPHEFHSKGGASLKKLDDKSILVSGENPSTETYTITSRIECDDITAIRVEALPDDSFTAKGPGRSVNGNIVLTDVRLSFRLANGPDEPKPIKLKAASADFSQIDFPVALAIDDQPNTGWAIHPEVGKPHSAVFELSETPAHSLASVPESNRDGKKVSPEGAKAEGILQITLDFQSQFAQHQLGRFRLSVTRANNPHEITRPPAKILDLLAVAAESRTDQQKIDLRNYYRTNHSAQVKELNEALAKLRKEQTELDKQVQTTMVMQDMEKPRETFMLLRGQYDKKGEQVTAGVPASLPPLPEGAPSNRLGLAQWLVSPSQPLTARVIVNRFWQMYFGTGIVKTAEDFGTQGEWPVHPELLDWLASVFSQGDSITPHSSLPTQKSEEERTGGVGEKSASRVWDVKYIQRLVVTSATYRQSSVVTPALMAKDPENRLLARGPRMRLQVEFIRDQALAVSGLLNGEIGGRSVSPYQPPGIWEELAYRQDGKNFTAQEYEQSHGKDLYRRTMYTFIKRTAPPPTLVTFDAPDREVCTVRRARTNTPLQALILMNDPTYVEASRKLAERMMTEATTREDRIILAFRLATARPPTLDELRLLRRVFDDQLAVYLKNREAAIKLLAVGESPRNEKLDPAELAAWTMVANVILNLDETVTKS